jgi:hypothetical protein
VQALQYWQGEPGSFAGAGLRAYQHIVTGDYGRNGLGLHGRRLGIAAIDKRARKFGQKPEGIE